MQVGEALISGVPHIRRNENGVLKEISASQRLLLEVDFHSDSFWCERLGLQPIELQPADIRLVYTRGTRVRDPARDAYTKHRKTLEIRGIESNYTPEMIAAICAQQRELAVHLNPELNVQIDEQCARDTEGMHIGGLEVPAHAWARLFAALGSPR